MANKTIQPAYLDYHWTDQQLLAWEKEIFNEELGLKTFDEYLIRERVVVINDRYPSGAISDHKRYRELTVKWSCLNDLRYRNEKANGFTGAEETKKKIKIQFAKLVKKMSVPKLEEIEESKD